MSDLERDESVQGKVITGGIAQSVTREGGVTRVKLTLMPGTQVPVGPYGGTFKLPEPVRVEGGGLMAVDMEWLPEPDREQAGRAMRMPSEATITTVYTGPSAEIPGGTQAAVAEGEPNVLPDLFWSRFA